MLNIEKFKIDNNRSQLIIDDIIIEEDSAQVDGIGGVVWEGGIILGNVLKSIFKNDNVDRKSTDSISNSLHLVELGCGSGICGIISHHKNDKINVTLSDRAIDLALHNIQINKKDSNYDKMIDMNDIIVDLNNSESWNNEILKINAFELHWEDALDDCPKSDNSISMFIERFGYGDIIICAEHPGESKCSITGHGDGLGYYGNGIDHWEAKFWDCCGSEDFSAHGCVYGTHIPY
eukprot:gene16241-22108_t